VSTRQLRTAKPVINPFSAGAIEWLNGRKSQRIWGGRRRAGVATFLLPKFLHKIYRLNTNNLQSDPSRILQFQA